MSSYVILLVLVTCFQCVPCIQISIDTSRIHRRTSSKFINVAIDTGIIRRDWENFQLNSTKVRTLAAALAPCSLRVGGTSADFLIFQNDKPTKGDHLRRNRKNWSDGLDKFRKAYKTNVKNDYENFTMTATAYDQIQDFVSAVGWDIIFDLNSLLRVKGAWNPSNAIELFNYTVEMGYKVGGWELGNEPDEYGNQYIRKPVSPEQLAMDFAVLRSILQQYPQFRYLDLLGPSVAALSDYHRIGFFYRFLSTGGGDSVTVSSFHQYYCDGAVARLADFYNPDVLNVLYQEIHTGINLTRAAGSTARVCLGETSSCWRGGAPGLSDTYVAAFMWLDKLGMSARDGIDTVVRHTFYGGNYSLINTRTLDPNPDFWLTLMYKLLIGNKVLRVLSPDSTGQLRAYAHCTNNERSRYQAGSVTVFIMNLGDKDELITLRDFPTSVLHVYNFMSGTSDIQSKDVRLNGQILAMIDERTLPNLLQLVKTLSEIYLKSMSYSFIVIPDANLSICKE